MTPFPCGAGNALSTCCAPFIDAASKAETAEQLMRARYTAHTLAKMKFIVETHHPSSRGEIDEAATEKWAAESDWLGLDIRDVDTSEENTTRIEFTARYRDPDKQRHTHHEVGVFEKYHGQWYFRDAEVPEIKQFVRETPKQGRNDPCACGSGKKHKKCCGLAA